MHECPMIREIEKSILVLLVGLVIWSCGEETEKWDRTYPDGRRVEFHYYRHPETQRKIKHGWYRLYHPSGRLKTLGIYRDGKQEGKWIWYFENGNISSEADFKDGYGKVISYYESGAKLQEGTYKNEIKTGKWVLYYEDGNKAAEGNYKDWEMDGKWMEYHKNGAKRGEGNYKNGERDGKWVWYDENEKMLMEKSFKDEKVIE